MSSAKRIWLLVGVLVVAVVGYLLAQSLVQDAETEPSGGVRGSGDEASFPASEPKEFAPGRIIVEIEESATRTDLAELNSQYDASTEENLPRSDVSVVDLPRDLPVREAVARYEASPDVEYAEPDFLLQPTQTVSANDPDYPRLYGLNNSGQSGGVKDADVDAPESWGTTTGDPGTVVAVIDEGVDISHPDLKNNVWNNADEVPNNGIDDDRNGYVDDANGYDFANDDASVYDRDPVSGGGDEHGTHVAGTIAAEGNNSLGVVGVNWRAKVMPLKFLGADGGYTSDAVEAINYAVANGATISNNSWGGGGYSQALRDAIARADAAGHLFVAAAGNGGADGVGDDNDAAPSYPSGYDLPNVVSVAATDNKDALASFSNYGAATVDLAAPGVVILSTLPNNAYGSYSGTSMAAPHVTGAAALLKSRAPALDDAALKARLLGSVDGKPGLSGKAATGGRLNVFQTLGGQAVAPTQNAAPTVMGVTPPGGATGVKRASNAAATFSEEMSPATLAGSTVTLKNTKTGATLAASIRCDSPCKTVTLDPSQTLPARTKFSVAIKGGDGGARDVAGAPLAADKVWTYTTGRR